MIQINWAPDFYDFFFKDFWLLKLFLVDLCLDLETLKGEMELDSENMGEEQDKLCRELASVQESLKRLRAQNAELSNDINEKNNAVSR